MARKRKTIEAGSDQTGAPATPAEAAAVPDQSAGAATSAAAVPDLRPGSVSESGTATPQAAEAQKADKTQDAQEETLVSINGFAVSLDAVTPGSPNFEPAIYDAYLQSLDNSAKEAERKRLQEQMQAALKKAADIGKTSAISGAAALLTVNEAMQRISESLKNAAFTSLHDVFQFLDMTEWADRAAQMQQIYLEEIEPLIPFLDAEAAELSKKPGFEWVTGPDLLTFINLDGTISEGGKTAPPEVLEAIKKATEKRQRADAPKAIAKKADIVEYPIDKVNSAIWNILKDTTGRQTKLTPIKAEKDGSKKQLNIYYSIDFEELENSGIKITKRLLPFDKRVYIAVAALYNAGNNIISLTQIYYAMGNTGKPAKYQLEKINDSITKMRKASVFLDTLEESQAYNYPRFKYEDYLLPVARTTAIVNGQLAEAAIQLKGEPPLVTFAKQRKQITTITVRLLQSPISKTDANLLIDDYLIERIARAKSGKQPRKILYETLYEKTDIKTYKQKERAPDKIKTYLEHYKACGLITGYRMLKDGIEVDF